MADELVARSRVARNVEVKHPGHSHTRIWNLVFLASTTMLLRDRRLWLFDDSQLLDELGNVRLKETSPGVLRMDHDPDKHDDRAIALALAALALVENPVTGHAGSIYTDMAPVLRPAVGNGGAASNPITADPWARARSRQ